MTCGKEDLHRLALAENRVDEAYYQCARRMGAGDNELALLYALDDGGAHTQKQLADEWLIPKTTINTIVRALEREGCLVLSHEEGAREKAIVLTEKGRARAAELLEGVYAAERAALLRACGENAQDFIDTFERFARCLCEELRAHVPAGPQEKE